MSSNPPTDPPGATPPGAGPTGTAPTGTATSAGPTGTPTGVGRTATAGADGGTADAVRRGRWRRPRSLRSKLVALLTALLALACLSVAGVTEVILHRVLYQQMDAQLLGAAGRANDAFSGRGPGGPGGDADPARPRPEFRVPPGAPVGTLAARLIGGTPDAALIVGENGESVDVTGQLGGRLRAVPVDEQPRTYTFAGRGDYRVLAHRGRNGDVLITGLSLANAQETLIRVAVAGGAFSLSALLLAGLVGAYTIRRELRPLDRVAATAARVTELRLARGEVSLPVRVAARDTDPGTEAGQVGAALNRLLDHVGDALRARHASETRVRQFVADASHELRTPLAAIRGYAELAQREPAPVPERIEHALRRVDAESRRMTTLVEDLLLLARLDAGRPLAMEPVDLRLLAVDTVSDAHAAGPRHDWQLDLPETPVVVTGDPQRLHQVLANLLTNARTHTPEGTRVTVAVGAAVGHAEITVTDAGPGIDPAILAHVFERFARGDSSRSRAAGSTGLGLSIVAAVVGALGGTVAVASVPGRTAFTVRLPLTDADHPDADADPDADHPDPDSGSDGGSDDAGAPAGTGHGTPTRR
ncbi:sensor histidine kinase [Pilimelia anulata]|uniref:histidine kinase n=1 Tax=Pilimelia anulata TaxID=53371 RepID=A0A8J3F6T4_9ACTN|nr:HAMP domain-containing sensor histidine kinase [Pilimelia anulata]GGJ82936.1 sensor histidine kinase [Pilimelia anulata]